MKAVAKGVKVSTRKVRLVADAIRNQSVVDALKTLSITRKHGSYVLEKAIKSAVANSNMQPEALTISQLLIEEGQFLKRYHASTRGRVHPFKKRTTHITVVLKEKESKENKPAVKAEVKEQKSVVEETKREENK